MNNKKIVFLTGTRADFGKLKPLIEKIENSTLFECYIFVTGMHTLSKYGSTFTEVQKEGYKNVFVYMNQTHTTDTDVILSNTITGFSNFVKEIKPNLIVIHGDRIEALAGATVGAFNNILVSHVEGGELSGTIDEIIRHTVTKLSHLHFVANDEAKTRLLQMGESENSVFVIGSPDIDIMKSKNLPSIKEVKNHYDITFTSYAILIFHPVTTELDSLKEQISQLVKAVIQSNRNYVVIYPNNDNGTDIILDEYKHFESNKNFKIFPSIRFEYFLTLLKNADFIIGNSSVGVREAGIYAIPAINIGTRQKNRTKNNNVKNIPSDLNSIQKAIIDACDKKIEPNFDFGDGNSSARFYEIIIDKNTWMIPLQKQFIDLSKK